MPACIREISGKIIILLWFTLLEEEEEGEGIGKKDETDPTYYAYGFGHNNLVLPSSFPSTLTSNTVSYLTTMPPR